MSALNKGLGRGLDALFGSRENVESEENVIQYLPLESIIPNPDQPRQDFNPEKLAELAKSIESQGIMQPLLLRPARDGKYQIVAGERRWRAAALAGLSEAPALVRELDDREVMAAALIENLQREDLNPVEEAQALKKLRDSFGLTQEDLAARLGRSRSAIANSLRLLQLGEEVLADIRQGKISSGHARALLGLEDGAARDLLHRQIISRQLTVRDCENLVSHYREQGQFPAEFLQEAQERGQEEPAAGSRKTSRKRDRRLKLMQKQLRERFNWGVKLSGSMEKGKITISYDSEEALRKILRDMGLASSPADPDIQEFV